MMPSRLEKMDNKLKKQSSRNSLNTAKTSIINAINSAGNTEQQKLALTNALLSPNMLTVTKSVIFHIITTSKIRKQVDEQVDEQMEIVEENNNVENQDENQDPSDGMQEHPDNINNGHNNPLDCNQQEIASMVLRNVLCMMQFVKRHKRINNNLERFIRIMFTLITSADLMKKYSTTELGRLFGYSRQTIKKRLLQGLGNRMRVLDGDNDVLKYAISQKQEKNSVSHLNMRLSNLLNNMNMLDNLPI